MFLPNPGHHISFLASSSFSYSFNSYLGSSSIEPSSVISGPSSNGCLSSSSIYYDYSSNACLSYSSFFSESSSNDYCSCSIFFESSSVISEPLSNGYLTSSYTLLVSGSSLTSSLQFSQGSYCSPFISSRLVYPSVYLGKVVNRS